MVVYILCKSDTHSITYVYNTIKRMIPMPVEYNINQYINRKLVSQIFKNNLPMKNINFTDNIRKNIIVKTKLFFLNNNKDQLIAYLTKNL